MAFTYIVPYAEEAGNISNTANITINNANVTNNANVGNNLTTSNLFVTNIANVATLNANGNVSFTGANISLGSVSNLHIAGGTANYFLQTDGAGNLTWATAGGNTSNISNGTSNVSIATSNGNITMSVNGTSNVVVVSSTSADVTGNINASNANLGNLVTANFYAGNGSLLTGINGGNVSNVANANYANFAGTIVNSSQPNITSVGTLTSLSVSGNITSGNANLGNLVTANYINLVNANLNGNSNTPALIFNNAREQVTINASGANGNITYDVSAQSLIYYTGNATGNVTLNFTNVSAMAIANSSITVAFLFTNGATPYYISNHQINGTPITPKWIGNVTPNSGDANSVDAYTYTIINIGGSYVTLAALTQYK